MIPTYLSQQEGLKMLKLKFFNFGGRGAPKAPTLESKKGIFSNFGGGGGICENPNFYLFKPFLIRK